MNDQRRVIFDQRKEIMRADDVHDTVVDMRHEAAALIVERSIPVGTYYDAWDSETLDADARRVLGVEAPIAEWFAEDGIAEPEMVLLKQCLTRLMKQHHLVLYGITGRLNGLVPKHKKETGYVDESVLKLVEVYVDLEQLHLPLRITKQEWELLRHWRGLLKLKHRVIE